MPGLDPGIHSGTAALGMAVAKSDCRVKPGNDDRLG